MAGMGYPPIIDLATDPDACEGTPEFASSTALVPEGYGYLDTPIGPDILQYNPPTANASGNAVPVNAMSQTNVLNQHLHVHQAPSTDARLIEAVAEERHRHAMDVQGEQLKSVSTRRDEMRAQGFRFMNEAEQMFHENAVVKHEATAFVEAAQKGYEAYAEASTAELRPVKQHHESQMLDARIRSDHAIEKCMATIESLNRQTESLHLELRPSMKKQTDLQSQLTALRDARQQNDLFNSWSAVRGPEGPAVLGPRGLPMIPAGGINDQNAHEYSPSVPNPATLRQTVKQEPENPPAKRTEADEESLFGSPLGSVRSGKATAPVPQPPLMILMGTLRLEHPEVILLPLGQTAEIGLRREMKPGGTFGRFQRSQLPVAAGRLMTLRVMMTVIMGTMRTMMTKGIFQDVTCSTHSKTFSRAERRIPRTMPKKQITSKFLLFHTPKATETGRSKFETPFAPLRKRRTKLSYGLTRCGTRGQLLLIWLIPKDSLLLMPSYCQHFRTFAQVSSLGK